MRGLKVAAIVGGVAVTGLIGAFVLYRLVVEQGGPAFEESFDQTFRENCVKSAREASTKQGKTGPEAEATVQRWCSCALEVVKPMPVADKVALGNSEAKQREVLAEVRKRCQ